MAGTTARRLPRPDIPTGEQLIAELRAHAEATGSSLAALVRPLVSGHQNPSNWIRQTLESKWPRQSTIDRVRAVIDGKEPPPPATRRAPRRHPERVIGAARLDEIRAEAEETAARRLAAGRLTTRHPLSQRPPTESDRSASPSELLRWAREDWPEVVAEVSAYAEESGNTIAAAWKSVITAGLQCLREAD
jgi:hypothetical protein